MLKTFTYPQFARAITSIFSILGIGVFILAFTREGLNLSWLAGFLFVLTLSVIAHLQFYRTRVILDEERIIYQGIFGVVTLKWTEIDDVHYSPHSIFITSRVQKKRVHIFRGEYGLALEPFDDLQKEITKRATLRLAQIWERLQLPVTYACPGLRVRTTAIYMIALSAVLFYLILLGIQVEGLWVEKIAFVVICVFVTVPFFIRDYRRNRKNLIVEQAGLRQTNGAEVFIDWTEVASINVTEEAITDGSIIVESTGNKTIKIPRSLMTCGQVLYLIKRKSNQSETYNYKSFG